MRCRLGTAFFLSSFVLGSPGLIRAQDGATGLRLRIETADGAPLGGALVALVDGQRVVTEALSSSRGDIRLAAAPGTYRIRVRRIGYRPWLSDAVSMPHTNDLVLRVESERIVLDAMVVSASARCGKIASDAQALSAVWDEIEKALRASQLTVADLRGIHRMRTYRREVGMNGAVMSNDTSVRPVIGARPFASANPGALSRLGYVRGDQASGWEYFGPDEAVLLSDDFAATHCFKVVRDKRRHAGEIGVAFEPAPKRTSSDIMGVLWVDEKSSELRDVHFVYVNAGVLTQFKPGGFTKFLRMPSGAWLVSEWQLRMPTLELRLGSNDNVVAIGYIENGGIIETEAGDGVLHR
jgi:carboxypeptidase family protein